MKRFLLMCILLGTVMGAAYQAYAATQYTASSVWSEVYDPTLPCCGIAGWPPERHWSVDYPGAGCNTQGSPSYNGSTITAGHWRDQNTWQLTKTWMTLKGCISAVPCVGCGQTTQSCARTKFKAWCSY